MENKDLLAENKKLKEEKEKLENSLREQTLKATILQNSVWKLLEELEGKKKGR